ncbi:MAG: hypothetical protein ACYS21_01140, partial [Planctomycetota bacterium]
MKKGTWQETMRSSRKALGRFEVQEVSQRVGRLKELGIELGPWYSVGPFGSPNLDPYGVEFGPELETDLDKTYADGTLKWVKRPEWEDGAIHKLPGNAASGEGKVVANYVFRNIAIAKEASVPVYLGSNDGIQVWFNGEKVLAKDIGRKAAPDQDVVNLNFKSGDNKLLIKVNNRAAAHAFYFSMHPGGGVRAKRSEGLWTLLKRDFADETTQRQMKWEQQDKIWQKSGKLGDLAALADSYAKATKDIGTLPKQAKQHAENVKTSDQLQKVRDVYYRSRSYDESITDVEAKLRLVTNQFAYLQAKYKKKEHQPEWASYSAKLNLLKAKA